MKNTLFFVLIFLSSCTFFENEVFENNTKNISLEPSEEVADKSFFGPGYSFWKELRSVERGKIELSNKYKELKKSLWVIHHGLVTLLLLLIIMI